MASGAYAPDMLTNLNPPTVCMVLLGVAQACLLEVFSPALRSLMRWRPAQTVAHVVGSRALTIYLWHLPLVVAVMAAWLLAGGYDPAPGSAAWWWLRIPLAVLCWAAGLAVATARRRVGGAAVAPGGARPARLSGTALAIALVCATVPPLWEFGPLLTVPPTIAGAVGSLTAVVLLRSGRVAATDPVPSPR